MATAMLDITDLKITPSKWENSNTRALCSATFNDSLVVHGIRIIEGKKGIYVAFPLTGGRSNGHTGRRPLVYPATPEIRREISNRILATYVINHCVDEYTV